MNLKEVFLLKIIHIMPSTTVGKQNNLPMWGWRSLYRFPSYRFYCGNTVKSLSPLLQCNPDPLFFFGCYLIRDKINLLLNRQYILLSVKPVKMELMYITETFLKRKKNRHIGENNTIQKTFVPVKPKTCLKQSFYYFFVIPF